MDGGAVLRQKLRPRGLRPAWIGRAAGCWVGCWTAAWLLSGCGFRTDPQPVSGTIPPTADVQARFREDQILVSWKQPPTGLSRLRGAVVAYYLTVLRLPLGCTDCRPVFEQQVRLRSDSPDLNVEGQTVYFQWKPLGAPTQWLIEVRTRFQSGESAPARPARVEGVGEVPGHTLSFEAVAGSRQVRLYWRPRQEREVTLLTPGGGREVQPVYYRANVYRRFPPAPWGFTPLNAAPDDTLQYLVQPPAAAAKGGPGQVEYSIRLVDQFGNEGPLAPPVSFSSAPGASG